MICDRCRREITVMDGGTDNAWVEETADGWVAHYADGTRSPPGPSKWFAEQLIAQDTRLRMGKSGD